MLVLGLAAYLGGWLLGWIELMVVAAGCLVALLLAAPFVVGRLRLVIARRLAPERVTVGDRAVAQLTIRNPAERYVGPRIVEDRVAGRPRRIEVPGLAGGQETLSVYDLPTAARGCYEVGPSVVAKADPLGLLRREVVQAQPSRMWVHPAYRVVRALPVGFAKDLEGPTSDASPAGDVSFHTLREYQVGDDYRHIHWLSTARTGTTMIRHYVDNRRPHLAVLLDDRALAYEADTFETAVSVAASLGVSSLLHSQPIAVGFGPAIVLEGRQEREGPDAVLDALTLVEPGEGSDPAEGTAALLGREPGTSAMVVLTGAVPTAELLGLRRVVRRGCRLLVVRVWPRKQVRREALPGASLLDVDGLEGFAAAWDRIAR